MRPPREPKPPCDDAKPFLNSDFYAAAQAPGAMCWEPATAMLARAPGLPKASGVCKWGPFPPKFILRGPSCPSLRPLRARWTHYYHHNLGHRPRGPGPDKFSAQPKTTMSIRLDPSPPPPAVPNTPTAREPAEAADACQQVWKTGLKSLPPARSYSEAPGRLPVKSCATALPGSYTLFPQHTLPNPSRPHE